MREELAALDDEATGRVNSNSVEIRTGLADAEPENE